MFSQIIASRNRCRHNPHVKKIAYLTAACCLAIVWAMPMLSLQRESPVKGDDSDWWSRVTEAGSIDFSAPQTHTQHRELTPSTLQIASVKAGLGSIARAARKFGKTTVVMRGDAAENRKQACYVSDDSDAYLIFQEDGEGFGGAFYLFDRDRPWHGSEFCSRLPLNSEQIQTASGLRLGLTRNEAEAILGKSSTASPDKLTYILEVEKKASPSELARSKAENPSLSDSEVREDFGSYFVTSDVVAKFTASKLVYLAVTNYQSRP